ncbi:Alanine--tRNA ligase [Naganishia albida]|nr:Alanine--tRNA ligase [Naganishia albida]
MSKSFEKAKQKSYELSKSSGNVIYDGGVQLDVHDLGLLEGLEDVPKTQDDAKYAGGILSCTIKAIYQNRQFVHNSSLLEFGTTFGLLLDQTNFYAESGGQEHDTGTITIDGAAKFEVTYVQVYNGYVLHVGHLEQGRVHVGDEVTCTVDQERRRRLAFNHTATHLLNLALRETLGDHVDQRGSLVAPGKLRLDYTHNSRPTDEQLHRMEELVRISIGRGEKVYTGRVKLEEALEIPGIRAVFGERYPNVVRCVSIGSNIEHILPDIDNPKWRSTSIELCGGTHVENTKDIVEFVIVREGSIAKGIRRIVATTEAQARQALRVADELSVRLDSLAELESGEKDAALRGCSADLSEREAPLVKTNTLKARIKVAQADCRAALKIAAAAKAKKVYDAIQRHFTENPTETVYIGILDLEGDGSTLNAAIEYGKKNDKAIYVFGVDHLSGKVLHQNFVPKDMVCCYELKASEWLMQVATQVGGKGGGNDNCATGSGSSLENIKEAAHQARVYFAATVERGAGSVKDIVEGMEKL